MALCGYRETLDFAGEHYQVVCDRKENHTGDHKGSITQDEEVAIDAAKWRQFTTKPLIVKAQQWLPSVDDAELVVPGRYGDCIAHPGWWVIQDEDGFMTTCEPKIFEELYEG